LNCSSPCKISFSKIRENNRLTGLVHPSIYVAMRTNLPTAGLNKALAHLRLSLLPSDDLTDRMLLERFLANRDEAAFAALVQRHGRLVMGICNRVLGNVHDCEDVFQAVFFILARKADSVVKQETLASWLYTVAHRASLEARETIARRRLREHHMVDLNKAQAKPVEAQDWMPLLDRELSQLPNKYRTLIVLCDLEGKSRKQVSQQVGLKLGTLASRLATARRMLAARLSKYGLTVSGGALAASLAQSSASAKVPVSLVWTTAKAATLVAAGQFVGVSVPAVGLMKGTMKMMFLAKLKTVIGTSIVAVLLGVGGLVYNAELAPGGARAEEGTKPKSELEKLRKENELLKMNLQVTLEKIIAQEDELKKLRGQPDKVRVRLREEEGAKTDHEVIKRLDERTLEELKKTTPLHSELGVISRDELASKVNDSAKPDVVGQLEMAIKVMQGVEDKEVKARAIEALLQEIEKVKSATKKAKEPTSKPVGH
jgi:RNA polymerase sigma factor (sigma-70 family)